jgi:hypothetical protein
MAFQAKSKFFKIRPSRAKGSQRKSKEKAWISLDSLVGIEPFQGVAPTPKAKRLFSPFFSLPPDPSAPGRLESATSHDTTASEFRKEKSAWL